MTVALSCVISTLGTGAGCGDVGDSSASSVDVGLSEESAIDGG